MELLLMDILKLTGITQEDNLKRMAFHLWIH